MAGELKNTFSWSKTRDGVFRECLRKYYFQYYGYWNGWKSGIDPRVREIYVLKKLVSRPAWAGDQVHRAIRRVLNQIRTGEPADGFEQARDGLLQAMRKEFKESRQGLYRQNPKTFAGLFDHEYQLPTPDAVWKETADRAERQVKTFFDSELFAHLRALPAGDWLEVEERSAFDLNGLNVLVQLDCAFRENGGIRIYDWKTGAGQEGQHQLQMACYALYASAKWQLSPEQVIVAEFNLESETETIYPLTPEILEETKAYIHDSADEMLFPLDDPAENRASEVNFDFTDSETTCHRCKFLKICPKWT